MASAKTALVLPLGVDVAKEDTDYAIKLLQREGYIVGHDDMASRGTAAFVVACPAKATTSQDVVHLLRSVRLKDGPGSFLAVWSQRAITDPFFREDCFGSPNTATGGDSESSDESDEEIFDGRHQRQIPLKTYIRNGGLANMVTYCGDALTMAAKIVASERTSDAQGPRFRCPYCGQDGFTEDELWTHCPLYHVAIPNKWNFSCPICRDFKAYKLPFPVHLRNTHGPVGRGELEPERSTGVFAVVVVRDRTTDRFLAVQEFSSSGFWLPGGQLDPGESLIAAAERETLEEAGVNIIISGILAVEIQRRCTWRRVVFYAEPAETGTVAMPKSFPDYESAGACWVTVDDVLAGRRCQRCNGASDGGAGGGANGSGDRVSTRRKLKLRGYEPASWFPYVANGGEILPLQIPQEFAAELVDVPL